MDVLIEGTPYFRRINNRLARAVRLRLPEPFSGPVNCNISGDYDPQNLIAQAVDGVALVYCIPENKHNTSVQVSVEWEGGKIGRGWVIAPARPWTIYIAQDKHLDFGWIHPVEKVIERINMLSDYALDHLERWNFELSIWVEGYPACQADGEVRSCWLSCAAVISRLPRSGW